MKQINTIRYDNYKITDKFYGVDSQLKTVNEMRVICDSIFQRQHQPMTKRLITLCNHSSDRYSIY